MEPSYYKAQYESLKAQCRKDLETKTQRYLGLLEMCKDMHSIDVRAKEPFSESRLELLVESSLGKNDECVRDILGHYLKNADTIDSRYSTLNRLTVNILGAGVIGGVTGCIASGLGYLFGAAWIGLPAFLGFAAFGAVATYKLTCTEHKNQSSMAYIEATMRLASLANERAYSPLDKFSKDLTERCRSMMQNVSGAGIYGADKSIDKVDERSQPLQEDEIRDFLEEFSVPASKNMIN